LLKGELARKRRTRQRGKTYGPEVDNAIYTIARSLDYSCAERLKPNQVWMAQASASARRIGGKRGYAGKIGTHQYLQPAAAFARLTTRSRAHCPSSRQTGSDCGAECSNPDASHGLGRSIMVNIRGVRN